MDKIKILLAHPRHNTVGAHSSYVPINIGYIAAYLKKEVSEIDIEFKLEVDPKEFKGRFLRAPLIHDVPYPVSMEPNLVIEYYSR